MTLLSVTSRYSVYVPPVVVPFGGAIGRATAPSVVWFSSGTLSNELAPDITVRVETESDGTRRRMGGEVKGKEANGVGSQQSSA